MIEEVVLTFFNLEISFCTLNIINASCIYVLNAFLFWLLQGGRRSDGRTPDGIRPINSRCGLLPRAHGSALFTRGETQVEIFFAWIPI